MNISVGSKVFFSNKETLQAQVGHKPVWGEVIEILQGEQTSYVIKLIDRSVLPLRQTIATFNDIELFLDTNNNIGQMNADGKNDLSFIEHELQGKIPVRADKKDSSELYGDVSVKPISVKKGKQLPVKEALKSLCGKNDLSPAQKGVYHDAERKLLVATNGYVLAMVPEHGIEKTKIVHAVDGSEIDERYVDYMSVVPFCERAVVFHSVGKMTDSLRGIVRANKYITDEISAAIEVDGRKMYFSPAHLLDILLFFHHTGSYIVELAFSDTSKNFMTIKDVAIPAKLGLVVETGTPVRFSTIASLTTSLKPIDIIIENELEILKHINSDTYSKIAYYKDRLLNPGNSLYRSATVTELKELLEKAIGKQTAARSEQEAKIEKYREIKHSFENAELT